MEYKARKSTPRQLQGLWGMGPVPPYFTGSSIGHGRVFHGFCLLELWMGRARTKLSSEAKSSVRAVCDWHIIDTWIHTPIYPVVLWSVFGMATKSNNAVEGWYDREIEKLHKEFMTSLFSSNILGNSRQTDLLPEVNKSSPRQVFFQVVAAICR